MSWTQERARLAALKKHGRREDDPAIFAARRDLAAAQLEAYIARVVAEAPAFTDEQRQRIGALLNGARVA